MEKIKDINVRKWYIIKTIKNLLIELGKGFAFVGNQFKITVENVDYFIDLLFII